MDGRGNSVVSLSCLAGDEGAEDEADDEAEAEAMITILGDGSDEEGIKKRVNEKK